MTTKSSLPSGARRLPDGRIKLTIDVPPGPDGKRRQRSRIVLTVAAAKSAYAELKASIDAGTYQAPSRDTLEQFLTGWLAGKARSVKPTTHRGYAVCLKPVVAALGGRKLQSVTKADVELVITGVLDRGRTPRTANLMLAVIKMALDSAVAEGLIRSNPAGAVKRSREARPEMKTWSRDELQQFLTAPSTVTHSFRVGFELAALGLRRGEVCGLRWEDVDLDARTIHIRTTEVSVASRVMASTPKSSRSIRKLPLDAAPGLLALLREARSAAGLRVRTPGSQVLVTADGYPPRPEYFGDEMVRAMVAAGVPVIRVHDVRHTFATLALSAGRPVHLVAAWLGHDPAVTLRTYAHAVPSELGTVAGAVVAQ